MLPQIMYVVLVRPDTAFMTTQIRRGTRWTIYHTISETRWSGWHHVCDTESKTYRTIYDIMSETSLSSDSLWGWMKHPLSLMVSYTWRILSHSWCHNGNVWCHSCCANNVRGLTIVFNKKSLNLWHNTGGQMLHLWHYEWVQIVNIWHNGLVYQNINFWHNEWDQILHLWQHKGSSSFTHGIINWSPDLTHGVINLSSCLTYGVIN
jgi:hypothetical protein